VKNTNNILWCIIIYEIIVVLLRTLRFPEIKACETTEKLGELETAAILSFREIFFFGYGFVASLQNWKKLVFSGMLITYTKHICFLVLD
jgi:hypothetical protein